MLYGSKKADQGRAPLYTLNTNVTAQRALFTLQTQGLVLSDSNRAMATGSKLSRAADGPSDLGIETNIRLRLHGNNAAIHNAEDTINLLDDADAILGQMGQMLQRMRELLVRASNEAPLTSNDQAILLREVDLMRTEIGRLAQAGTFNTKLILFGDLDGTVNAPAQIGADNGADFRLSIVIPNAQTTLNGFLAAPPPPNPAINLTPNAQAGLTQVDTDIASLATMRSGIGSLRNRLTHIINDLTAENINQAAAKSRLADTDFASEITRLTRHQILTQSGAATLAQANSAPMVVLQLLS